LAAISVYRQLGLALEIASVKDLRAEGIAELLIHQKLCEAAE